MTKAEIIEYLYENNVKGDITIEQMAEDLADRKDEPQTHEIRTNTHECVKDTHDKTEQTEREGE